MLDIKYLLANVEAVKQNCRNRNVPTDILDAVDVVVELEQKRKTLLQEVEEVRRLQNANAQATGKEKDPEKRQAFIAEGKQLKASIGDNETELKSLDAHLKSHLARIPNLTHPDAPIGALEDESLELRKVGTPRAFDFKARDHVEIGKALDLIDFESGAKVSGHGFYFLKNDAVLLELALQQFAIRTLVAKGFSPIVTPDLARNQILEGIGFTPRGTETQIYSVEESDLSLIGTAEITLGGMHADEIFDEAVLPLKYVGLSHCFRTEAGAAGRASKGLYRVHQFTKIEMFAFTTPEASNQAHAELLAIEEEIFTALGIPYRVLDICSGDLGGPAYRKYDLEAWMPGRGEAGEYGEVTSTSDCTDYQARRLNIRYRPSGQKGTRFVHTLNGTALALSRALIVILENYQRADGLVDVPTVLQPYMGKEVIGRRP
ncbi:serine--tRNA ligase [Singulisphaera acidiphila]|uniref:Serine--tRNA ligase n=1 Tax=Singulisphaera acidiphila (strain ATCC BAA-1392 / DSM 18658 / VKM B-2454 / MOB10) TaxID=886293 RepID=L0DFW4_SINAD|nr:serine--tRNA ligase [Singulisphaera acidiphila]AGA27551.1 seryl-tRNA synthetase [Singulisphaera acidiphila DSM 18658]